MGDDEHPQAHLYGQEAYEAAGSPLFTKLWTYEELMTVERPGGLGRRAKNLERPPRPDWFPADTEVDKASWVYWLPEGWIQGLRTQVASGKTLKCYMSPEEQRAEHPALGKRYWHRKDLERALLAAGLELGPQQEKILPKVADGEAPRVKYVTDPDTIPSWPTDEEEWLPKDWSLVYRQLPSGPHKCYVPPNQEDGFYFHRKNVEGILKGEYTSLSLFGNSRPQLSISKDGRPPRKKGYRKFEKKTITKEAIEDDYVAASLVVVDLPMSHDEDEITKVLKAAACANADGLASDCVMVRDALKKRQFNQAMTILAVFFKDATEADTKCARYLSGIYYEVAEELNGHAYYQKVQPVDLGVCGKRCWMYWSFKMSEWRIGTLGEQHHGLARCDVDKPATQLGGSTWKFLPASFFVEPSSESAPQENNEPAPVNEEKAEKSSTTRAADPEAEKPVAKKSKVEKPDKKKQKGEAEVEQKTSSSSSASGGAKTPPPGHPFPIYNYDEVMRGDAQDAGTRMTWPDWLPKDWGRSQKEQSGKMKNVFVQPCWKRFAWLKGDVLQCLRKDNVGKTGGFLVKD